MDDPRYRYSGPVFPQQDISPIEYRSEFFRAELEMESELFFDLRKLNHIKPYRIVDSSEKEQEEIADFFRKNAHTFFFLSESTKIIGSILLLGNYIQSMCVQKEYQRKGYGEQLTKYAINYALQHGYGEVFLDILPGNIPAENLYTKIGFKRVESSR